MWYVIQGSKYAACLSPPPTPNGTVHAFCGAWKGEEVNIIAELNQVTEALMAMTARREATKAVSEIETGPPNEAVGTRCRHRLF